MSAVETLPLLAGLPPLVDERSRVLILGSFPSELSLAKSQYYGNPRNHFWQIMEALFGIDASAPYSMRTTGLLEQGIAVWDVIGRCRRRRSGDDEITDALANSIADLLERHPRVRRIAFNGGMAERTAKLLVPSLADLHCERLPSTSPRNAGMSFATKLEAWARIKDWLAGQG